MKKLIFDIGMHKGEDTIHYLQSGYKVIAVEANPILAKANSLKFQKYINKDMLIILNVGIADREEVLPFYKNLRLTEWSSFDKEIGGRNGTKYEILEVPCITTNSLFVKYGVPHYMKVDIEGYDYLCINAIDKAIGLPNYVSCESTSLDLVHNLYNKGYTKFKMIHQGNSFKPIKIEQEKNNLFPRYQIISNGIKLRLQKFLTFKHPYGSSGPFAENTKSSWLTYEEVCRLSNSFYGKDNKYPLNNVSWFDYHATF
jgi:FkbM family methyltransferase